MSDADTSLNKYSVDDARFLYSAPNVKAIKAAEFSEAAFAGRSNVGKSTLLNSLVSRKSIARTSRTPGRTQAVNFFEVNYRMLAAAGQPKETAEKGTACFADLPGYGFAKVPKGMRRQWEELIEQYLFERENLHLLLLLLDCRRVPREEEQWLASLGESGNLLVVLTKADKLSRNQLAKQTAMITKELGLDSHSVFPTALVGKSKSGVDALRNEILDRLHAGSG